MTKSEFPEVGPGNWIFQALEGPSCRVRSQNGCVRWLSVPPSPSLETWTCHWVILEFVACPHDPRYTAKMHFLGKKQEKENERQKHKFIPSINKNTAARSSTSAQDDSSPAHRAQLWEGRERKTVARLMLEAWSGFLSVDLCHSHAPTLYEPLSAWVSHITLQLLNSWVIPQETALPSHLLQCMENLHAHAYTHMQSSAQGATLLGRTNSPGGTASAFNPNPSGSPATALDLNPNSVPFVIQRAASIHALERAIQFMTKGRIEMIPFSNWTGSLLLPSSSSSFLRPSSKKIIKKQML